MNDIFTVLPQANIDILNKIRTISEFILKHVLSYSNNDSREKLLRRRIIDFKKCNSLRTIVLFRCQFYVNKALIQRQSC